MKLKATLLLAVLCFLISSCAEQSPKIDRSELKPSVPVKNTKKSSAPKTQKAKAKPVEKAIKPGAITGIEMGRVFTMQQGGQVLLVDCRPPIFYRLGHLDGAINLPLKTYDTAVLGRKANLDAAVAAKQTIVLYCQNTECPDAYGVAKKLITLGYSVSIYKGGWEGWKRAGL